VKVTPRLDETGKTNIQAEWGNCGGTSENLSTLEIEFASNVDWFAVEEGTKTIAVFEIRQAPSYIKNMKVLFAPDVVSRFDHLSYAEAKPLVTRMINALGAIFEYLLSGLANGISRSFKIYSDQDEVRFIFYEFCRYLEKEFPDKYEIKIYRKWLDIMAKT